MKKIIAAAVATAFVAPAFAADVTVSGYAEFSYQDANGATTSAMDNAVTVKATGESANGITVSADMTFNSNSNTTIATANTIAADTVLGNNDGGHSITVSSADLGTVDMGDTSSAIDAIDDVTEYGVVFGQGTGGGDAAVLWTLPTFVNGLTVNVSHSAETNFDGNEEADGWSVKYTGGMFTVGVGGQDNGDGTSHGVVNGTLAPMPGLSVAAEVFTDTATTGIDTDTTNYGLKYTTGDVTLGYETSETKASNAAATSDEKVISIAYNVGGGLAVGVESYDDDLATNGEQTAIYASFTF
jgi:hypothetical protein